MSPVRPRLLDLFCGAGGAGMGYHLAGWEVVGVDLAEQPSYPFEFHRGEALEFPLAGFDAVHASPPCQLHNTLHRMHRDTEHPNLIPATRARLRASGLLYVIENVEGAPLLDPLLLCGSMFALGGDGRQLRRHRLFDPTWRSPRRPVATAAAWSASTATGADNHAGKRGLPATRDLAKAALGMPWARTMRELAQAIPPAYTQHIGSHLGFAYDARASAMNTTNERNTQ